jgi:hypothetical protein
MKISPNWQDAKAIRAWADEGLNADQISRKVNVLPDAVQRHLDTYGKGKVVELTPQQRGAVTRKKNDALAAAKAAADADMPGISIDDDYADVVA